MTAPPAVRPVQVIAHRGSSGAHAEHTLTAYERALQEGADALECDVRLTRDGVLVCVHDRRVDRTSDGRGVVSALELQQLDDLDFASWKDRARDPLLEAAWEEADTEGSRVLTLERLLELVLDYDRTVQLHIETKHPTRYGPLVERTLVDVLQSHGLAAPLSRSVSRVCVLSFSPISLRRIHALAPAVPTQLNMERVPVRFRDGSLPPQVQTAGISLRIAKEHPRYIERVHARGHRVHVFTVDDAADIDYVLERGADGIISNHPKRVLRRLGRA